MHTGKPIMSLKVGVNYYYSLSHHDCTPLSQERFITAPFLFLRDISTPKVFHSDMGGAKKKKGVKRSEIRKNEKKGIKRERLCIFIYIKSMISVIATKGQGLEFHSLSCTTGAVTALTFCLSAAMMPAALHCGSRRKAESTL